MSVPTDKGITLQLDDVEFITSQTVTIKGVVNSDASRLQIEITDESKCGCSMLYPKDPKIVLNPNQRNIIVRCQI